jgi:outer membrane lipoprotein carrier protein
VRFSYARLTKPTSNPRVAVKRVAGLGIAVLSAVLLGGGGTPPASEADGGAVSPEPRRENPPPAAPAQTKPARPAQDKAAPSQPTESADAAVDALQSRYERVKSIRASFVQQAKVASLGKTEESRGTVVVRRPGRMRWEYATPEKLTLVLESGSVKMYSPGDKKLQIAKLDPQTFSPTALQFLLGEGKLSESFTAESLREDGRKEIGLRLRPRNDSGFEHLDMWLAPDDYQLRESVVVDLFGNRTAVRFSEIVENDAVPDDAFSIDVPEGTDVIDVR